MPFCNPRHGRRWPFGFSFVLTTGKPDKTPDNFAWRIHEENLDRTLAAVPLASLAVLAVRGSFPPSSNATYDITTLAGKVASVNGTPGLQIRFSALIESEADTTFQEGANPSPSTLATPGILLSSPLDGTSVLAPAVTVNQDRGGAPQNETSMLTPNFRPAMVQQFWLNAQEEYRVLPLSIISKCIVHTGYASRKSP